MRWYPPKGTDRVGRGTQQATFNHLPEVFSHQGGPSGLEVCKCDTHLQEVLEKGSGEQQACQPDLGGGELMEQIILSALMQHLPDHQGIRTSQQGLGKGKCCLTNLISTQ